MANKIEESPLGWEIVLLFIILNAADKLMLDIDFQLELRFGKKNGFDPQKKYYLKNYFAEMKKARHWLDTMFKLDDLVWGSTDNDKKKYNNAIADSNELIQIMMYYLDRGHTPDGYDKIVHFLRSLPTTGLFPQNFIERFIIKRQWVYAPGDRVHNANHGDGTLDFKTTGDNWNVKFDSGLEVVLNEKQFEII